MIGLRSFRLLQMSVLALGSPILSATPKLLAALPTPRCHGMTEHPAAGEERTMLNAAIESGGATSSEPLNPLAFHLSRGLAYTVGSALGCVPPSRVACLTAFIAPNSAGLTAGARAWTKHAHRSSSNSEERARSEGWWGSPSGPVAVINERALMLFEKVVDSATWRNLHWLPHEVLVYEARVEEGYGMRWAQDRGTVVTGEREENQGEKHCREVSGAEEMPWTFRGFVEPMMQNGHEIGWRH